MITRVKYAASLPVCLFPNVAHVLPCLPVRLFYAHAAPEYHAWMMDDDTCQPRSMHVTMPTSTGMSCMHMPQVM